MNKSWKWSITITLVAISTGLFSMFWWMQRVDIFNAIMDGFWMGIFTAYIGTCFWIMSWLMKGVYSSS